MPGINDPVALLLKRLQQDSQEQSLWQADAFADYVLEIFLSRTGKYLLAVGTGGLLARISTRSGKIVATANFSIGTILVSAYHAVQALCWVGSDKGIFEVDSNMKIRPVITETGWFEKLCTDKDASILVAARAECLYVWGRADSHYALIHKDDTFGAAISDIAYRDGLFLVSYNGCVRVYPAATGFTKYSVLSCPVPLLKVACSPDKKYICSVTRQHSLHFWPYPMEDAKNMEITGFPSKINCLAWQEHGRRLAVNCGEDIAVWDFEPGPPVDRPPLMLPLGMGRISRIYYRNQLLIAANREGFLFSFVPEVSAAFLSIRSVDGIISSLAVDEKEEHVFAGTEAGRIIAFNIDA